jgi:adenylyltransferase/sulfurtransferase
LEKNMPRLGERQQDRYIRHSVLPGVGKDGLERLRSSSVLIVGAGGLGSPCALYLAAVGVGRIGLLDSDRVDLSNLNRQILHDTCRLGIPKALSGMETLNRFNPDVRVVSIIERIRPENAVKLLTGFDIVLDCTDNFAAKFLLNDACVQCRKPLVHAGVSQYGGQVMTVLPGQGPCYRCVFSEPPPDGVVPSPVEAGILGAVPGVIGTIQATEAIKFLLGLGDLLVGRLLVYDALKMAFREVPISRDPDCAACGGEPKIKLL